MLDGITTAVEIDDTGVTVSWLVSAPSEPNGSALPEIINAPPRGKSYSVERFPGPVPTAANWVWSRTRGDLAKIMDDRGRDRTILQNIVNAAPRFGSAWHGWRQLVRAEYPQLFSSSTSENPVDLWPGPDLPASPAQPLGSYSEHRMHARVCAMLRSALDIYRELTETALQRFNDTLPRRALMPIILEGNLTYNIPAAPTVANSYNPTVNYWLRPAGRQNGNTDSQVQLHLNSSKKLHESYRSLRDVYIRYGRENPELYPFLPQIIEHHAVIDVNRSGWATLTALHWIYNDLKRLRWGGFDEPPTFIMWHLPDGVEERTAETRSYLLTLQAQSFEVEFLKLDDS